MFVTGRVVSISLETNCCHSVRRVSDAPLQLLAQSRKTLQRRLSAAAPRIGVIGQAMAILHGHEDGQRPTIPFDDEALSGGRLVEDPAERPPEVERGNDSHGQP